jgi:predicted metal-dependent peptidase
MSCKRQFDETIPTLGVGIDSSLYLKVNPFFWNHLSVEAQAAVLEHEVLHVLHDHFSRMQEFSDQEKFNRAADCAINCFIAGLPKTFNMFDRQGNVLKDKDGKPLEFRPETAENRRLKVGENAEYYYHKIKSDPKGNSKKMKQGQIMPLDDHSEWDSAQVMPEYTEQKINQIIQDAVEKVGGRDSGQIPDFVKGLIDEIMHKPKNWKKDIQRFASRTSETLTRTTRKKPNRRFGFLYPARKKYPKLTLGIGVDTSASVNDEEQDQFMAEIHRLSKMGIELWIMQCDSRLHSCEKYDPKKGIEIKGRGGTSFKPVFEKCKELEIDGLIYLTDGEDFDRVEKPKFPVLWALLKGCKSRYDWGFTTEVDVRRK